MIAARVGALALGVLFALASAGKMFDLPATARGLRALGFRATYRLAVVVPLVEAILAAVLVIHPRVGGAAAMALLVVFSAVLADRLQRGITPPCNCFGATGARPLSLRHLVRNAGLAAAALTVALAAGANPSPAAWAFPSLAILVAVFVGRLRLYRNEAAEA